MTVEYEEGGKGVQFCGEGEEVKTKDGGFVDVMVTVVME